MANELKYKVNIQVRSKPFLWVGYLLYQIFGWNKIVQWITCKSVKIKKVNE